MTKETPVIVLFRRDLRLDDNPALAQAASSGLPVIPLFVDAMDGSDQRPLGAAARWWQGLSLIELDRELRKRGARLIFRKGEEVDVIEDVLKRTGAISVFFNWRFEPAGVLADRLIASRCRSLGVQAQGFPSNHLHDPALVRNATGQTYKVFTPFWNRLRAIYTPPARQNAAEILRAPARWPMSLDIAATATKEPWTIGLKKNWRPGALGAEIALSHFIEAAGARYAEDRDRPDLPGTSLLSPYLASGNICIHEVWRRLQSSLRGNAAPFLRQLAWRDFNMHLMAGFGDLWRKPLRPEFEALPYRKSARDLRAWQRGETGYPIVDAGMRQLWATGWMHNRVRMIAASFLVKHLLIDWREGEAWFWDTLVDADPSQNPGNWQWVAGCGADAAPYFRIFNPILQGRRFDPDGTYIRKWVPELSNLPAKFIHAPFAAPLLDLAAAGIQLGRDYCAPIVDHKIARDRALAAFAGISARTRL